MIQWILRILIVFILFIAVAILLHQRQFRNSELCEAAQIGDLTRVRLLIAQGAPINERPNSGFKWTPLLAAIFGDNTNVAHYLIESGADVNARDRYGETPLMYLVANGDKDASLAEDLLSHGANLDITDNHGSTIMDYVWSDRMNPKLKQLLEKAHEEAKQSLRK